MISKNISKKKTVLRTLVSIVLVTCIFVFYGFNNQEFIKPVIEKYTKTLSVDSSGSVPSILPLKIGGDYWIGSHYGWRKHPVTGKKHKHNGLDIAADRGTEIIATADGKVIETKYVGKYGNRIKIQHSNNVITLYAHLYEYKVNVGDIVKQGDVIGTVGSTGMSTRAHVHYEVRKYYNEKPFEFLNPANYITNIKEIPLNKSKTH